MCVCVLRRFHGVSSTQAASIGSDHVALLVDGGTLIAWGYPTASLLETTERTITAAGTESTLARGGWKATAAVVRLPKGMHAGLVSSAGRQCVVRSAPVPFFPHGEVLNRALYTFFEWWGAYTGTGMEVRGQTTVTRTGWSLLGRALGLITNMCLYKHWQVYFDEVRDCDSDSPASSCKQ